MKHKAAYVLRSLLIGAHTAIELANKLKPIKE